MFHSGLTIYRALKILGAKRGDKILELGAGCGLLARYLRQRGFRVIGVDIDCSYWLGAIGLKSEDPPVCVEYDLNKWEKIIPKIINNVGVKYVTS